MQKIIPILSFCFIQTILNAQSSTISNVKSGNICYFGIENALSAFIENTDCKNVVLKTKNGTIEKKAECIFIFKPVKYGITLITIYKKKGKRIVEHSKFNLLVKKIPNPTAFIGRFKTVDTIPKISLLSQIGIRTDFDETSVEEFGIKAFVIQYRVLIKRNDLTIFNEINKGGYFTERTKSAFDELLPNDRVIFSEIMSDEFAGSKQILNNIELMIKLYGQ